jgi:hypothetical protein
MSRYILLEPDQYRSFGSGSETGVPCLKFDLPWEQCMIKLLLAYQNVIITTGAGAGAEINSLGSQHCFTDVLNIYMNRNLVCKFLHIPYYYCCPLKFIRTWSNEFHKTAFQNETQLFFVNICEKNCFDTKGLERRQVFLAKPHEEARSESPLTSTGIYLNEE